MVASPTDFLEQPEDLHLDAEFSRGRSSLRPLDSEGKQRVRMYGGEMNDWVAHSIPEIGMDDTDDSNQIPAHSAEILPLTLSLTETSNCRRQRPNSSPPMVPRLHLTTPASHLVASLNSNASSSTAALIARSRSADAH